MEKTLVVDSGMEVLDMRRIDEIRMRETMEIALEKLVALGG